MKQILTPAGSDGLPWHRRRMLRLKRALPSVRELLIGSPAWGVLMALSAFGTLYLRIGAQTSYLDSVMILYFSGGLIAWPCGLFLGRFCAAGHTAETRFAAFFVCLTLCTIAATAALFALDYRTFYVRWHAPFGTRIWTYQFIYTCAAAVYQFVVLGIRLYLPFGFSVLALTSLWLARPLPDLKR